MYIKVQKLTVKTFGYKLVPIKFELFIRSSVMNNEYAFFDNDLLVN